MGWNLWNNNIDIKFGEDITVSYIRKNCEKSIFYLTYYMLLTNTSWNRITWIFSKPLSNHIKHLSNIYQITIEHLLNHQMSIRTLSNNFQPLLNIRPRRYRRSFGEYSYTIFCVCMYFTHILYDIFCISYMFANPLYSEILRFIIFCIYIRKCKNNKDII